MNEDEFESKNTDEITKSGLGERKNLAMIFDDEDKSNKNIQLIFLHKLFLISCFLNLKDLAELFITKMHLNPFY